MPAHGVLELQRVAVGVETQRFPVEHEVLVRNRQRGLHHLWNSCGDLVQAAREDTEIVAAPVHLHPRSVELPLHARRTGELQRFGDACRAAGQHRLDTDERLEADLEGLARQCQRSGRAEIAQQHRCSSQIGGGDTGGLRNCVADDTAVGSLAHLATEETNEMRLLVDGEPTHQPNELLFAVTL